MTSDKVRITKISKSSFINIYDARNGNEAFHKFAKNKVVISLAIAEGHEGGVIFDEHLTPIIKDVDQFCRSNISGLWTYESHDGMWDQEPRLEVLFESADDLDYFLKNYAIAKKLTS